MRELSADRLTEGVQYIPTYCENNSLRLSPAAKSTSLKREARRLRRLNISYSRPYPNPKHYLEQDGSLCIHTSILYCYPRTSASAVPPACATALPRPSASVRVGRSSTSRGASIAVSASAPVPKRRKRRCATSWRPWTASSGRLPCLLPLCTASLRIWTTWTTCCPVCWPSALTTSTRSLRRRSWCRPIPAPIWPPKG